MKIYVADVTIAELEYLEAQVSADRIERSRKYKAEIDCRRSLGVEALLNYALRETYPALAVPVQLGTDLHEKPHLIKAEGQSESGISEQIEFSLSHSGRYAACALASVPVGVDIELHKNNNAGVARRFFTRDECADITDEERFYLYWTLKESFLKAVGQGLSLPMNSFSVTLGGKGGLAAYSHQVNEHDYFGKCYEMEAGYSLAVCAQGISDLPEEIIRVKL